MKRNFFHLLYIALVLIILAVPALGMLVTGPSQAGANEVLAAAPSLSLMAVAGTYPYIHNSETFDWEEPYKDIRQKLMERDIIKISSPEDSTVISLVAQGLGVSLLPRLSLSGITPAHQVKAVPLDDAPTRTISLLFPKKAEQSSLTTVFLTLLQQRVAAWEQAQSNPLP